MDENEWLADRFEEHRSHLRAVAYRMLGSLTEADDAVQDTWLRLSRAGAGGVENLGGWLTTIVARVCLNMLRSRGTRREEPLGAHLPDPVISAEGELQPEDEALRADFGARRPGASTVIHGPAAVASQALVGAFPAAQLHPALVNGAAGVVVTVAGRPFAVLGFTVTQGRIVEIDAIANPERVRTIAAAVLGDG